VPKGKGSGYEREICTAFGMWWTGGERDDVFWRASGSGARAKVRGRSGRSTAGQHGDVCATDPIGAPLIALFTIEIKRGYSSASIHAMLDRPARSAQGPYDAFLEQAMESHKNAGSEAWMLITRRDRRDAMVWVPSHVIKSLREFGAFPRHPHPYARIDANVRKADGGIDVVRIAGMPLREWFALVNPTHVMSYHEAVVLEAMRRPR